MDAFVHVCFQTPSAHALDRYFGVPLGNFACSSRTRDRLKLIPRVANLDEWAKECGLSGAVSTPYSYT